MKLLLQPPDSTLCGQYCVAMLAAVAPALSIAVFGTVGRTSTADVARALRHFGLHPATKLRRLGRHQAIPSPSILKIARAGQSTFHWVVFHQGEIYCPCLGKSSYPVYLKLMGSLFKCTSFLTLSTSC